MAEHNITSGVEEYTGSAIGQGFFSTSMTEAEASRFPMLPSSYDEGTEIGNKTQGVRKGELQETKTFLEIPKKSLRGILSYL